MQLDHSFTVPVPVEAAWDALVDFERVAPCLPGASLTSIDGDVLQGAVKVKLGPVMLNYKGSATILEKDVAMRRMVMDGRAKDSRGNGTAAATITAHLEEESAQSTRVSVTTELNITGRPAQFGRGMMQDVGNKVLGQFADRLGDQLTHPEEVTPQACEVTASKEEAPSVPSAADNDVLDLGSMVGPGAIKRASVGGVLLLLAVLAWRRLR